MTKTTTCAHHVALTAHLISGKIFEMLNYMIMCIIAKKRLLCLLRACTCMLHVNPSWWIEVKKHERKCKKCCQNVNHNEFVMNSFTFMATTRQFYRNAGSAIWSEGEVLKIMNKHYIWKQCSSNCSFLKSRAKRLVFDKHASGMSVKGKNLCAQQCMFSPTDCKRQHKLQLIYYATQSVHLRHIQLVLFSLTSKHKIVQQKQKN